MKTRLSLRGVVNHVHAGNARRRSPTKSRVLEPEALQRNHKDKALRSIRIRALTDLAEMHDNETESHVQRTQRYVRLLADCLAKTSRFSTAFPDAVVESMVQSAAFHDIGKVGIPEHILLKPGPLTFHEREVMKTHTILGCEAISSAEKDLASLTVSLCQIKNVARSHHECWDGSGYPDGLVGESIPLSARVVAVADVFDALISKRVYKDAMTCCEAWGVIAAGRGTRFDPDIVDAFLSHKWAFEALAIGGKGC